MKSGENYNTGKQAEQDSWGIMADYGYIRPNPFQRKNIIRAFHALGKAVSKTGFDLIERKYGEHVNDPERLKVIIHELVLYELKTAGAKRKSVVAENWKGLGFTLTSAEKNNATLLGENYKFIFLNLKTKNMNVYAMEDFFDDERANIYPTYSIFIKGLE